MDYGRLLTRSFEITRRYPVLWLFGVLFALFGGGASGFNPWSFGSGGGGGGGRGGSGVLPGAPAVAEGVVVALILLVACLVVVWVILATVMRLTTRGSMIGLVQELEANETAPTVRRGFRIGFGRFWSLLGIALIINVPIAVVSFLLIITAGLPLLAALIPFIGTRGGAPSGGQVGLFLAGIFSSIALFCGVMLLLILVGLVVRPFYEFFVRACVIGGRGALDSIREGYRIVRTSLGSVILLYILIIGVGIGFGLVMFPIAMVLFGVALAAGAVAYIVAKSVALAVLFGILVGVPAALILLFISGLYQVFESTLWTEGYLAVTAPASAPTRGAAPAPAV